MHSFIFSGNCEEMSVCESNPYKGPSASTLYLLKCVFANLMKLFKAKKATFPILFDVISRMIDI